VTTEVSRRTFWRAEVLKSLELGDPVHTTLEQGVVLEAEDPVRNGLFWLYQQEGFEDVSIPIKYLRVQKLADIVLQTSVTLVME
jgi:hypothetical protein